MRCGGAGDALLGSPFLPRPAIRATEVWLRGPKGSPQYRATCPECQAVILWRYDGTGTLRNVSACAHYPRFAPCGSAGVWFSR